jgi:hypothetical protein
MTEMQIALAMEALLCVAEGKFQSNKRLAKLLWQMEEAIGNVISKEFDNKPFGDLIAAQKEAVNTLVNSPIIFGHEP